ncbi:sigma-54-dependent transcriptional regulator [Hafnia alvei]|uniref:Sigma-54-dependent Fis family transcriptional regulator n=1 Tax=Hafnia alvei TaxID=569 RepID=A0ABD7Q7U5_HAFAL|nr:sigma-54 dependent transcriptional regulator [Hafnia alvei]ANC40976.1 Fis family transcriptional regulator [Hafnia alvei]KAA0263305.1 sigma-54-dependent Fis family transcriptional regulator [Hafnia alvei]KID06883.1 Fis family transcriptional regulator [Hafnia alvei]MBI0277188.1 sigma-54-dependent Fis family transcriptional regulator [Hafnia alvei]PNL03514.1 sigma-54-dependent Fis family transcriptional regulator [Hafnia alvei]
MTDIDVLIIEDDKDIQLGCVQALKLDNKRVIGVGSVEDARFLLPSLRQHGIIVTDMKLPGMSGLTFQKEFNATAPDVPVIIITGHGDVETAVEAMHNGAYDFLQKPFSPRQLLNIVRRALDKRRLTHENYQLRRKLADASALETRLIGNSSAISEVRETIKDIAMTPTNIMIYGETGSGKELAARCIHDLSGRTGPFVALNCGGLPESLFDSEIFGHESGAFLGATETRIGKLEYADQGTLFLDEVESMPFNMQVKFLRVLQERRFERLGSNKTIPVDIRIISASKTNLVELSESNLFRADLHFRLSVINLNLPALRERIEDIPLLFDLFVAQASTCFGRPAPEIKAALLHQLMAAQWPGNIRELRNYAERFVLGIKDEHFVASDSGATSLIQMVENFERSLIILEINRQGGSLTKTAEALKIPKSTLSDKIKKYSLK